MNKFEIAAEPRANKGKGASRRLRRMGKVPGILYGARQDAIAITLDHDDLYHHLEHEAFYSHILTLNIGGAAQRVVLKDLQRHPYKPVIQHIDLLRVSETEKLTMRIPIHFLSEDKCIGVKQGGAVISHIMTEVEVRCLPADLPEAIEVDLAAADVGTTIHLEDLVMPKGVENYALAHGGDPNAPVVTVHIPRVIAEEVAEAPAEGALEGAAPAEGAAAAAEPAAEAGKDAPAKGGKEGKGEGKS